jgi:hypothetical protein
MKAPEFPVGPYVAEPNPSVDRRAEWIGEIERLPQRLKELTAGLTPAQLDVPYRNWTVRQIVHHLADSHMNAFVRFRLALTEDRPAIKPYDETRWADLVDTRSADIELSLRLLEALHARWTLLLRAMSDRDFERSYYHPEHAREFTLSEALGMYAHHGRHHAGQIAWLRESGGLKA